MDLERPAAEDLCRELNLCDEIRFVGKQEQMEDILSNRRSVFITIGI